MKLRPLLTALALPVVLLLTAQTQMNAAQTAAAQATTTTGVEVLYSLGSGSQTTVTTYNVNPSTLAATKVGKTLTLAPPQSSAGVITSPDDHFIYVLWYNSAYSTEYLDVYKTDAYGVPVTPRTQRMAIPLDTSLFIHPSGRFAYAQILTSNGSYVRLFQINSTTGALSNPQTVATYGPGPYLLGFNSGGTKLYDVQMPTTYATYYYRTVNQTTGALGPETAFFSTQDLTVTLSNKYIAELNDANENHSNMYIDVYANVVNPSQPLIHCTGTMLAACSSATAAEFDRSGQYLLIRDGNLNTSQTEVARVNAANQQLTATGAVIPGGTDVMLSPDGKLAYEEASNLSSVQVYRFYVGTGTIRAGSVVPAAGPYPGGFVPATRR